MIAGKIRICLEVLGDAGKCWMMVGNVGCIRVMLNKMGYSEPRAYVILKKI